jgi:hypothetical protein
MISLPMVPAPASANTLPPGRISVNRLISALTHCERAASGLQSTISAPDSASASSIAAPRLSLAANSASSRKTRPSFAGVGPDGV